MHVKFMRTRALTTTMTHEYLNHQRFNFSLTRFNFFISHQSNRPTLSENCLVWPGVSLHYFYLRYLYPSFNLIHFPVQFPPHWQNVIQLLDEPVICYIEIGISRATAIPIQPLFSDIKLCRKTITSFSSLRCDRTLYFSHLLLQTIPRQFLYLFYPRDSESIYMTSPVYSH